MAVRRSSGFTVVELMVVLLVLAVLSAIAVPGFLSYRQRAVARTTEGTLRDIADSIRMTEAFDRRLPLTLADAMGKTPVDPWGNDYQYLPFDAGIPGWKGKRRKDKNLVPINSKFDLYSMGPDGDSKPPLTAKASRDDIVYANDGGYIGPASDY